MPRSKTTPKILSCINFKGGVGKTTIAVNFAAYCGLLGKRTLLIDADSQCNASLSVLKHDAWIERVNQNGSIVDFFIDQKKSEKGLLPKISSLFGLEPPGGHKIESVIIKAPNKYFKNVDLIPSHLDLYNLDVRLAGAEKTREGKLGIAVKPVLRNYDVIIIDCPPNLTLASQNAIACSTHYVTPVSLDFLSITGIAWFTKILNEFAHHNKIRPPEFTGVIISRYKPTQHHVELEQQLRQIDALKDKVFKPKIHDHSVISQAASELAPIFKFSGQAKNEVIMVFKELSKRMEIT